MSRDWQNEPYVRLYTRDTATWTNLEWEGRATFMALLRIVDRAGHYDLGRWGNDGLSKTLRMPLDVVVTGVTALVTEGVIVISSTQLAIPNFIEAQNTRRPLTNAERQSRLRERRKNGGSLPLFDSEETESGVTTGTEPRYGSPTAQHSTAQHSEGESPRGGHAKPDATAGAKTPPRSPRPRSDRSSKDRLPVDWTPHREDVTRLKADLRIDDAAIADCAERMRDHYRNARGRGARVPDPRARFRKWVRDDVASGRVKPRVNGGGMSPAKKYTPEPMLPKEKREEIAATVRTTLGIDKDAAQ